MGLISRVSSRTYRFTKLAKKQPQKITAMSSTAKPKATPKRDMSYFDMVLETFRDEKLRRLGGTKTAVQKSCFSRFNIDSTKSANTHFTMALKKQIAAGKISAINHKTKEASESMGPLM